ncbi:MAG: sulfatase-like hydrolase/transferase, partial [Planctomycetota bacterium]
LFERRFTIPGRGSCRFDSAPVPRQNAARRLNAFRNTFCSDSRDPSVPGKSPILQPSTRTSTATATVHRIMLLCILQALQWTSAAQAGERPVDRGVDPRPNVIFFLTDDQGWGDAGFAGHPYLRTPGLDRLAAEGTRIQQFYTAASVCSPSRTGFLTGTCPARHRIHGHFSTAAQNAARGMPNWLDPSVPTLSRLLQQAGYATGHFGKWHLGSGSGAPLPEAYGFDVSRCVNGNGPQLGNESEEPFFRARSTARIVDETIAFMQTHRDRPFFINAWTLLPHAPLRPLPEQLAPFANLEPDATHPAFGPWLQSYYGRVDNLKSQMQVQLASLADLDAQVARLLAAIDELQLTEHTLIVYSSDNGPEDDRIGNAANAGVGSTGPLRARKRSLYEGGIRTPGLIRWPGRIPAGRMDDVSVAGGVDLLPTICRLANVTLPTGIQLDGEDLSRNWLGAAHPRTRPLHWEWLFSVQGPADGYQPPPLAVRDGDWKLFVDHRGLHPQLYRIPADSGEEHDLSDAEPEVVKRLTKLALEWSATLPASAQRTQLAIDGIPRSVPKKSASPSGVNRAAAMKRWDRNADGQLTLEEYSSGLAKPDAEQRFRRFDTNADGALSRDEFVGKDPG